MTDNNFARRYMDTVYHDLLMPEEAKKIREEVREFADKEIRPVARFLGTQTEAPENFPWELLKKMGDSGILGIPFPKEYGGRGLENPICGTVVALEEIGYISDSVAAIMDVQVILCGNAISYGSEYLKQTYLTKLIAGDVAGCFATTEPDASTDLRVATIQTTAENQDDGGWLINGRKRFITNGPVAAYVTALCRTGDSLTQFLVPLDSPGVSRGKTDIKIGNKGQLTCDLVFENVKIPPENLIGEVGDGLKISLGTLAFGRVGIGATGVGMAQSAFDESVDYMKKRQSFGKNLSQYQHWQFKAAEWMTMIESARNIVYKAAVRRDKEGAYAEPESAMGKYYATEVAATIAKDAVQLFGGYGFMQELGAEPDTYYKVNEIYRDSKITEIYEGTNEIQKIIMLRDVFDRGDLK